MIYSVIKTDCFNSDPTMVAVFNSEREAQDFIDRVTYDFNTPNIHYWIEVWDSIDECVRRGR